MHMQSIELAIAVETTKHTYYENLLVEMGDRKRMLEQEERRRIHTLFFFSFFFFFFFFLLVFGFQ